MVLGIGCSFLYNQNRGVKSAKRRLAFAKVYVEILLTIKSIKKI